MKRLARMFILAVAVAVVAPSALLAEEQQWSIRDYVDAFMADSEALQEQLDRVEDLEADLETAQIRKESPLALAQRELDLEVARLAVREIENAEITKATELYIAFVVAEREHGTAAASLENARTKYTVVENRYDADEDTEEELLSARISLLTAEKSLVSAEYKRTQAISSALRSISIEQVSLDPRVTWSDLIPNPIQLDDERIRASNSAYSGALETLRLRTEELELKKGSDAFTIQEVEAASDARDKAESALAVSEYEISDTSAGTAFDLETYSIDLEIAGINLEMNQTEYASVELQYEFGEVLEFELANALADLRSSGDQLEALRERLFLLHLEAADFGGEKLQDILERWIDG